MSHINKIICHGKHCSTAIYNKCYAYLEDLEEDDGDGDLSLGLFLPVYAGFIIELDTGSSLGASSHTLYKNNTQLPVRHDKYK